MKMPEKPKPYQGSLSKAFEKSAGNENVIRDLIKKYNEEYVHWDELRRKDIPFDPEDLWALMKLARGGQSNDVFFDDIHISYVLTLKSNRIIHLLDTGASGMMVLEEPLKRAEMDRYVVSSLMEEAIASSQIEGAVTTTKVAKLMLRENRKPRSTSEKMIVNDYLTMQRIKELKGEKLTPELILELHKSITNGTLEEPSFEGRFRLDDDIVVADIFEDKVFHTPPPAIKIPRYVEEICDYVNTSDRRDFQHPIIKAVILHFMIGYVHPFIDGNGRLARALMYWYCLKENYWLVEHMAISKVIKESKGKYGLAYLYTETDDNDVTYFINYNLWCMEKALNNTRQYISKKQQEQREAMAYVNDHPELNFRQAEILRELIKHEGEPFSILEIASKFNVVRQTARADLLFLEKKGFVQGKKDGKKNMFTYHEAQNKRVKPGDKTDIDSG